MQVLLQAYDYAADCGVDAWQFAVELSELLATGMSRMDLRWLLCREFVEHARETTVPGDAVRSFRRLPPTSIPDESCLVLTGQGVAAFRSMVMVVDDDQPPSGPVETSCADVHPRIAEHQALGSRDSTAQQAPTPSVQQLPAWDTNLRELHYGGQLVKKYRVSAANQELILSAFEEEGWPVWIDDPLPPAREIEPKKRLQATINSLNRNQITVALRFHVNHNGQIVSWEPLSTNRAM